jgi:hypothetical protein
MKPEERLRLWKLWFNGWVDRWPNGNKTFEDWLKVRAAKIPPQVLKAKRVATNCYYCGLPFNEQRAKTVDHFFPVSSGTTKEDNRFVVCCYDCNQAKKNEHPAQVMNRITSASMMGLPYMGLSGNRLDHMVKSMERIFNHITANVPPAPYYIKNGKRVYKAKQLQRA